LRWRPDPPGPGPDGRRQRQLQRRQFKDYTGACYTGQPTSAVVGQGCYLLPGTTGTYVANYDGERLTNAPKWSYNLNAAYERRWPPS
jgi:hypothetical protein